MAVSLLRLLTILRRLRGLPEDRLMRLIERGSAPMISSHLTRGADAPLPAAIRTYLTQGRRAGQKQLRSLPGFDPAGQEMVGRSMEGELLTRLLGSSRAGGRRVGAVESEMGESLFDDLLERLMQ